MENRNMYWLWAGVASCGLLLLFAVFSGLGNTVSYLSILILAAAFAAFWADSRRSTELLDEVHAEEKRLAELVENIPAGIGIYVFENGVLKSGYLNQGYYKMLGVDKEKRRAERKEFLQFVHPDDLPAVLEEIQRDFLVGQDFEGIFRLLDGSGKYRWVNLRVRQIERHGNRRVFCGAFYDNDSLMQAHQAMRESQMVMKAALTHSGLQAWEYYPATGRAKGIVVSPKVGLEMKGGKTYTDFAGEAVMFHPDDIGAFLDLHRRVDAGEDEAETVIRARRADNEYHWVRIRYSQMRDEKGRVVKVLGTAAEMDAYKELENRFQTTVRQTGIAVGIYDVRSHQYDVYFRDREFHFDNGPEGVIGEKVIHPEDEERYRSLFRRIAEGKPSASALVRFCSSPGNDFRWTHIVLTAIPDRDGNLFRAMMTQQDVTEQIRREMRYREELLRRQALEGDVISSASVNLSQDQVQECMVEGERIGSAVSGKDWEWAVEQEAINIPDENDRREFRIFFGGERLKEAYRTGQTVQSYEYLRKFPNGNLRWVKCRADLAENPETGDLMLFAYVRDNHQAKIDEIAFARVVEGIIDYISCVEVASSQSRFVRIPETEKDLPEMGLGDSFSMEPSIRIAAEFLPDPVEREELLRIYTMENLRRELENNPAVYFNFWLESGGVRRRKELYTFYLDEAKTIIVNVQRDITDTYLEAEEKRVTLEKALAEAEQASRAKSDFLSRMSHEIRTPMNAIIGLTALARGRTEDAKYVAESLSKMDSAAHFLLDIINDVLDISRIERGKMMLDNAPHNMAEFLEGIDVIIRARAAEGGVRYSGKINGDLPAACVFDALKLKQVLVNILSNAVKFTPRDGSVEFRTDVLGMSEDTAVFRFSVKDTGIGIDRDFLPNIFNAFEQESAGNTTRYGGTGLGLAISKSIIDLMGGTIRVESEKNVGTVFFVSVTLPVVSQMAETGEEDGSEADFTGMRVLLAEDNEINREIATAILEDKGFTVDPATDGQEAVEKFRSKEDGFYDVILMDIRMPFLDGFGATEKIRGMGDRPEAGTIPIVAMTANAFEEDVKRARDVGMDDYLTKPVEPDTVYKVLWRLLRRKKKS